MARIVLLFGMCAVVIAVGHANAAAAGAAAAILAAPAAPGRPQAPQITGGTDGLVRVPELSLAVVKLPSEDAMRFFAVAADVAMGPFLGAFCLPR